MNLEKFLMYVDGLAESCDKNCLKQFVIDCAKDVAWREREGFLDRLQSLGELSFNLLLADEDELDFRISFENNRITLIEISKGLYPVTSIINKDYKRFEMPESEHYFYRDDSNVGPLIDSIILFVHKAVESGHYAQAYMIGTDLFTVEIPTVAEESWRRSEDILGLREMKEEGFFKSDWEAFERDLLRATYFAKTLEERPEALYRFYMNDQVRSLSIKDIQNYPTEEIHGFRSFLDAWIEFLKEKMGVIPDVLLREALSIKGRLKESLGSVLREVNDHPKLALDLIKDKVSFTLKERSLVAHKALASMDEGFLVRSRIALESAKIERELDGNTETDLFYLECFRSNSTPINYLRVLLNSGERKWIRDEMDRIFRSLQPEKSLYRLGEFDEFERNSLTYDELYTLEFLSGKIWETFEDRVKSEKPTEWSLTFAKKGIALLLTYLYKGTEVQEGIGELFEEVGRLIPFDGYDEGFPEGFSGEELLQCIYWEWRTLTPITKRTANKIIKGIFELLEERVSFFIKNHSQSHYRECAIYIAALGEVMESRGWENGKQKLMEIYHSKYPNYFSFKKELVRYGLKERKDLGR